MFSVHNQRATFNLYHDETQQFLWMMEPIHNHLEELKHVWAFSVQQMRLYIVLKKLTMIIRGRAESVSTKYQSDVHADPARSAVIALSRPTPIIRKQGDQTC